MNDICTLFQEGTDNPSVVLSSSFNPTQQLIRKKLTTWYPETTQKRPCRPWLRRNLLRLIGVYENCYATYVIFPVD